MYAAAIAVQRTSSRKIGGVSPMNDQTFPPLDLEAVDLNQPSRVQVSHSVLPDTRNSAVVSFPMILADAVNFLMGKPLHEQDRLEILTAPREGKRGRALDIETVRAIYAMERFPRKGV
jgi:hypothetical protein